MFLKSLQIQSACNSRIILTKDGGYFLLSANMAPPCGHSINSLALPWLSLLRNYYFLKNFTIWGRFNIDSN